MNHSTDDPTTDDQRDLADSNTNDSDLIDDVRFLRRVLRRTRRTRNLQAFAEGALWYVAALGAVVVTALLANALTGGQLLAIPAWILVAGGGAATIGAGVAGTQLWRRRSDLSRTARSLQHAEPDFRNDLAAALEFGDTLIDQPDASDRQLGFSRQLAAAHIRRTVESVREATGHQRHLGALLPQRSLTPPIAAVLASLTLCTLASITAPTFTAQTLRSPALAGTATSDSGETQRPLVSNIRIQYDPPPYTDQNNRTDRFTTGHIEAVEGTEVTISADPLQKTQSLALVIQTSGDERALEMSTAGQGRRQVSFVLNQSGSYTFRAESRDGETIVDPTERRIDVTPDNPPNISITSHSGTVEVSPDDTLDIKFSIDDDFGIDAVKQSYSFVGADQTTTKPVSVPEIKETPTDVTGSVNLDLRQLSLKPKDSVKFYIKATDNNERTGPGTGESSPLVLEVSSPEDKHLDNIQAQKKLVDKFVDLLAGYLESPVGQRKLQSDNSYDQIVTDDVPPTTLADRAGQINDLRSSQQDLLRRMERLVDTIKDDPLMAERTITLLEGLQSHLSELDQRGDRIFDDISRGDALPDSLPVSRAQRIADYAADMESSLETGTVQMMELIASQKMEAVQSTAKDIDELKNRLKNLLEKYKKTRDPELKKAIEREISRLRQRMAELTQRMQMQLRELPKQHLNKDALKQQQLESDTQKMAGQLKTLEQRLKDGDIDGALKALEQMDSNLASLNKSMDNQFSQAQPQGLSKLDKKVSELMDEVNQLQSAEKDLEKKTKKLRDQQAEQRAEQLKKMMQGETSQLHQKLDRQQQALENLLDKNLPPRSKRTADKARKDVDQLKQALDQQDLQQARDKASSALKHLRTMDFNLRLTERHSRSQSDAKQAMQSLDEMIPRGESIKRQLDSLMERARRKMPKPDQQQLQKLAEQQKSIQKRAQKLQQKISESGKEFPMLKQQLQPSMDNAGKQMGDASKRLQDGQPQGALDSERKALQQLGQLKQQMKRSLKRQSQREGNRGSKRRENIDIPGKSQGQSPDALRDEVMKNMKQEKLDSYEQEIEDYYKSLVE
jgi:protein subunit release factor A